MTTGLPETILLAEDSDLLAALSDARAADDETEQREAIGSVLKSKPTFLDAWAALGEVGRDDLERYSAYRVGYHRGLDSLRKNGWRGSGYVRWEKETNRGFLRCLNGLRKAAEVIGETDEASRCGQFIQQLDPTLSFDAID